MDRNSTNDRQSFAAHGPQARELTEAEMDAVTGGFAGSMSQTSSIVRDQRGAVSPRSDS
jgi:hypothetical protein